ncbi:MAG: hypothetical protein JXR84_17095 [Anaerolineae bacterium]|nr:hypothetical protein [Anaerolineae bacterium]
MKRQWIVLIAALFVLSLGCSLFSGKATEEPSVTAPTAAVDKEGEDTPAVSEDKPVATEEEPSAGEEEPATDEDVPFTFDANALEGLNSYRMDMTWSFTNDDGTVEEFSIQEEATRDPVAQRYMMQSGGESIEFILIEQTQWMRFGEEWMQTTADEEETLSAFGDFLIQPDEMFAGIDSNAYKYVGKETVNDMNTRHYQIKDTAWDMALWFKAAEIEEGAIDVWMADENDMPKFAVRYEMTVTGSFEEEGKGTLTLNWNIYDVNADITIEPPADVASLPEGLELCPDATDVMVMGQMSMFICPSTVADTTTFYTEMLENDGWEAGDMTNMETMVMGTWMKDGETLSLTITADDESGGSSVMVTLGE